MLRKERTPSGETRFSGDEVAATAARATKAYERAEERAVGATRVAARAVVRRMVEAMVFFAVDGGDECVGRRKTSFWNL